MNKILIGIIAIAVLIGGFVFLRGEKTRIRNNVEQKTETVGKVDRSKMDQPKEEMGKILKFGEGKKATMYKSPNCGCCIGYAEELEKQGFKVETVSIENMASIKDKYKIPANQQSCHTTVVGNYFIEGHVPLEALEKLLKEQPKINGIGLPKMPSGTPGMSGVKKVPYEVYQSIDGEFSDYLRI